MAFIGLLVSLERRPGASIVKTLCIASSKGGVGKTTTALNLAYQFAARGWRTLLVDVDPQGAIGNSLSLKLTQRPGLAAVLLGKEALADALLPTRLRELALLPVGAEFQADPFGMQQWFAAADQPLTSLLSAAAAAGFELVVMDTPAGVGPITEHCIRVSDDVLLPVQAEPLAARSLGQILQHILRRPEGTPPPNIAGIVVTQFDAQSEVSRNVLAELGGAAPAGLILEPTIARDSVFLRASAAGVPLGLLSRRPGPMTEVFDELVRQLEERMGMEMEAGDEPLSLLV